MNIVQRCAAFALIALVPLAAGAAGTLVVADAWIPEAPPGMSMHAGYATLSNAGDAPLTIQGAASAQYGDVSIHETVVVDGVSKMRALDEITLAPGAEVKLAPGGRHLMLMQPVSAPATGSEVGIDFILADGRRITASFAVRARDDAPHAHDHH